MNHKHFLSIKFNNFKYFILNCFCLLLVRFKKKEQKFHILKKMDRKILIINERHFYVITHEIDILT